MEVFTLLGIGEIFEFVYLELLVLPNKSEDGKSIVVELITVRSVEHDRVLCSLVNVMIRNDAKDVCIWRNERGG